MNFWDGVQGFGLALACVVLFMTWRRRVVARYSYATLYLASILLLDPLRAVFRLKFGLLSNEYYLAFWFGDYFARLLACLVALQFIELALEGSRLRIARLTFLLSRLFVVVVSGIAFISYYVPRLADRAGRFEFQLFIYLPATLLVLLAWIAYGRRGRSELQPRLLIAAIGLSSAVTLVSLALSHFAVVMNGHTPLTLFFALHGGPIGFLVMAALWLYAVTCLGPADAVEAREGEFVRASGSLSVLAAVFNRAKEET